MKRPSVNIAHKVCSNRIITPRIPGYLRDGSRPRLSAACLLLIAALSFSACLSGGNTRDDSSSDKDAKSVKAQDTGLDTKTDFETIFKALSNNREAANVSEVVYDPGGHAGVIMDAVATKDGRRIITCGTDKTIRFWDAIGMKQERVLYMPRASGRTGELYAIALSPDEKHLAAGGWLFRNSDTESKSLLVIDTDTWQVTAALDPGVKGVALTDMAYSDDGKYLVSATTSGSVQVWDATNDYRLVMSYKENPAGITGIAVYRTAGDYVVVSSGSDSTVVSADAGYKIISYSIGGRKKIGEFVQNIGFGYCATNGKYVAVSGSGGSVQVFDTRFELVTALATNGTPSRLSFSPDGRYLLVGMSRNNGSCLLFDASDGFRKAATIMEKDTESSAVAFLGNDTAVYTGGAKCDIVLFDVVKKAEKGRITRSGNVFSSLVFDSGALYAGFGGTELCRKIRLDPFGIVESVKPAVTAQSAKKSVSFGDYKLETRDYGEYPKGELVIMKGGVETVSIRRDADAHLSFGFAGDGYIYSGGYFGDTYIYDLSGKEMAILEGHAGSVRIVEYDGVCLYSYGDDSVIRAWDLAACVKKGGTAGPLVSLFVDGDGRWVAWTNEGYYAASGGLEKNLGLLAGREGRLARFGSVQNVSSLLEQPSLISSLFASRNRDEAYGRENAKKSLSKVAELFDEKGFYLTNPGNSWYFDPGTADTDNDYDTAYMSVSPLMKYEVLAEENTDMLSALSIDNLANLVESKYGYGENRFTLLAREKHTINGQEGIILRFTCVVKNTRFIYAYWISSTGKHVYNLVAWALGDKIKETDFWKGSIDVFSSFNLIGGPRNDALAGGPAVFESPSFGYKVDLAGSGWLRADKIKTEFSGAEFAALTLAGERCFVIPVPLFGTDPPLNAVAYALLQRINLKFPDDVQKTQKKIESGGLAGYRFDYENAAKSEYKYRLWVTRSANFAYLVIGYAGVKSGESSLAAMDGFFDRIAISDKAAGMADAKTLPADSVPVTANFLNDLGLWYMSGSQYVKAAECLRKGFELAETDAVILSNYLYAVGKSGQYREGLDYVTKYLDKFKADHGVFSYLPFFQSNTGNKDDAIKNYRKLFADGYEDEYDFRDFAYLLWDTGRKDEAILEVAEFKKKRPVPLVIRLEADLLSKKGDFDSAIGVLSAAYADNPYDGETIVALCEAYYGSERHTEGLELCARALANNAADATVLFYKGLFELGLKWYADAKASFEKSLLENPADETVRKYLDYASGFLGEGTNTDLKKEIEPVRIPEELLAPVPASEYARYADSDMVYINRIAAMEYRKGKECRITYYSLVKLNNQKGVTEFSTFTTSYDPGNESIYVNSLEVLDESGSVLSGAKVSDFYILDDTDGEIVTGEKTVNAPLKGLVPGNFVKVTFTVSKHGKLESFPFETQRFYKYYPVVSQSLYVTGDLEGVRYKGANIDAPRKSGNSLTWTVKHTAGLREEPNMAPIESFLPHVWIGDKGDDWEALGLGYLADIRDTLVPSKGVADLAKSKVGSEKPTDRKIETLARFVQKELTYKAILFGKNEWMPKAGDEILANKYGDCKDHALLLHLLLKSAGIRSNLALVNIYGDAVADIPSLDQFNHMIVYLPDYRKGFFIDATGKSYNVSLYPPLGLAGFKALVLDEKKPSLVTIPSYSEDSCRITSERSVTISGNGDAAIVEKVELAGYYGSYMRSYLERFEASERTNEMHLMLSRSGSAVNITECTIYNMEDAEKPLVITLAYAIGGHFHVVDKQIIGKVPALWEQEYLDFGKSPQRKTPFTLAFPFGMKSSVKINMPPGYVLDKFTDATQKVDNKFLAWNATPVRSGQSTLLTYSFKVKTGTFRAAEYAEFTRLLDEALAAVRCDIVHRKK